MKKSTVYIVIGLVCALVLALLFILDTGDEKKKKEEEKKKIERKPNDWEKNYGHRTLDPYGTFIFYQLLKQQNQHVRLLRKNSQYRDLDTIQNKRRLYVFVGQKFSTHYKRLEKVLNFVERGNDAFIAAEILPKQILSKISDHYSTKRSYYKNVELNFTDSALVDSANFNFRFIYKRKNISKRWTDFQRANYYYETYTEEQDAIKTLEKNTVTYNPVFIKVPYGKGYLYLHTVPYTLTNIVMKRERGVQHAERVISCLPNEPVIFDRFLNDVSNSGRNNQYNDNEGGGRKRSSPLQFILENRSLRWAYYLLLVAFVLYLLFKGKRMQKIIPPKEKFDNTSMDFADTMSKLYLQYGQHKYIVFQQEKNLVNYIRSRYYIHAQKVDEEYIGRVAVKSGIKREKIALIFERFQRIKKVNHATSNDVVEIYAEIEYFYKNCK